MKKKSRTRLGNAVYVASLGVTAAAGVVAGVSRDWVTASWTRFQTKLYAGLSAPCSTSVPQRRTSTSPSRRAQEHAKLLSLLRRND